MRFNKDNMHIRKAGTIGAISVHPTAYRLSTTSMGNPDRRTSGPILRLLPPIRGRDARETQGRDALATRGQDARDTEGAKPGSGQASFFTE